MANSEYSFYVCEFETFINSLKISELDKRELKFQLDRLLDLDRILVREQVAAIWQERMDKIYRQQQALLKKTKYLQSCKN